MVSVICSVYNTEKYINEAIDSILNQTYKDLEIIVIDDGSTDSTVNCLSKYCELPNFKLIKREHTGNVGKLLNDCVRISQGKYIAIMGADDLWLPHKLEFQMPFVDSYGMVCSNSYVLNEGNEMYNVLSKYSFDFILGKNPKQTVDRILINDFKEDADITLADLVEFNYIIAASVIMRKEIMLKTGGFEESLGIRGEDYVLWLNVAEINKIKFINEPLVRYRIHGDNLSLNSFNERLEMLKRTINIRSDFVNHQDISVSKGAINGIFKIRLEITKLYLINKHYISARKNLKQVLKLYKNKFSLRYLKYLIYYFGITWLSILHRR